MKIGYVVIEQSAGAMALGSDNVLWIPSGRVPLATLFTTLPAARRAIQRTRTYAKRFNYDWPHDYRVFRLG